VFVLHSGRRKEWNGIPGIIIMDLAVHKENDIELGRECRVFK